MNSLRTSALQALASRRLAELPESRAPGVLSYYSRGGAGYDDNVALRSVPSRARRPATQTRTESSLSSGSYSFGAWRVDAAGRCSSTRAAMNSARTSLYLGGARGFSLGNWYFEVGAYGAQLSLGGEVFEQNVAAGLQVARHVLRRKPAARAASRHLGRGPGPVHGSDRRSHGTRLVLRQALAVVDFRRAHARASSTTAKIRSSRRGGCNSAQRRATRCRRPGDSRPAPPCVAPRTPTQSETSAWLGRQPGAVAAGRHAHAAGSRRNCSCATSTSATIHRSRVMTTTATGSALRSNTGTEISGKRPRVSP